jgi:hypothetical protein
MSKGVFLKTQRTKRGSLIPAPERSHGSFKNRQHTQHGFDCGAVARITGLGKYIRRTSPKHDPTGQGIWSAGSRGFQFANQSITNMKTKSKKTPLRRGVLLLAVSHFTPGQSFDRKSVNLQWDTCRNYAERHGLEIIEHRMIHFDNNESWSLIESNLKEAMAGNALLTKVLVRRDIRMGCLHRLRQFLKKQKIELVEVPSNYEPGFHDADKKPFVSETLFRTILKGGFFNH